MPMDFTRSTRLVETPSTQAWHITGPRACSVRQWLEAVHAYANRGGTVPFLNRGSFHVGCAITAWKHSGQSGCALRAVGMMTGVRSSRGLKDIPSRSARTLVRHIASGSR